MKHTPRAPPPQKTFGPTMLIAGIFILWFTYVTTNEDAEDLKMPGRPVTEWTKIRPNFRALTYSFRKGSLTPSDHRPFLKTWLWLQIPAYSTSDQPIPKRCLASFSSLLHTHRRWDSCRRYSRKREGPRLARHDGAVFYFRRVARVRV